MLPAWIAALSLVQTPDAASRAYTALQSKQYEAAVAGFREAIAVDAKPALLKDFAYTLLKVGETDAARDAFARALLAQPADHQTALEYAYLCFETRHPVDARRTFHRLRQSAPEPFRTQAEQAFQAIDRPLAEGIARWKQAVEANPNAWSSHQELAGLAEQRDELALAAQHYEYAWRLRTDMRSFLLDLGRVYLAQGKPEDAMRALLAASRGAEPRTAERARLLLPPRYPYVYEFEKALELDPSNIPLRREFAYLLLTMGRKPAAEEQFQLLRRAAPNDRISAAQVGFWRLAAGDATAEPLLETVLKLNDEDDLADRIRAALRRPQRLRRRGETPEAKVHDEALALGDKSLKAGYLKDALRYLTVAHETDPADFGVMMKLGWTNNILKQDSEAVKWFALARKSPDAKQAAEANQAYRNLAPALARFRSTFWMFPLYSSRWDNGFGYAQWKTELKLPGLKIRPYVSTRFIGDIRGKVRRDGAGPVATETFLSETSLIFALGVASPVYKGLVAWAEAGQALRYLGRGGGYGLFTPDYRGGLSFSRGFGHALAPTSHGWFAESNNDALFISRFQRDTLFYTQNRAGWTLRPWESGFHAQLFWSANVTADVKRQPWANFIETGPGVRLRFNGLPPSVFFQLQALRGRYLIRPDQQPQTFSDLRAGFWYAFTR